MASKGSTDKSFQRSWVGLDNAGKIFLSTMTAADTKVFRLTACLKHKVRPDLLQEALDLVYPKFPLYHATIRRGLFWYFMEDTNLEPQVQEESTIHVLRFTVPATGACFFVFYTGKTVSTWKSSTPYPTVPAP